MRAKPRSRATPGTHDKSRGTAGLETGGGVPRVGRRSAVGVSNNVSKSCLVFALAIVLGSALAAQAPAPLPKTPLKQDVLNLLANEISGQVMFNNLVRLAGAPWMREPSEFTGTLYETQGIYDLVRSYGIETTRIERSATDRKVDYPMEGEL